LYALVANIDKGMFHAYQKNVNILQLFFYTIFFFFLSDIVSIVAKITKFEQEFHISNEFFLPLKKKKKFNCFSYKS